MALSKLTTAQFSMADFLRNPLTKPAPEGIEPRRLKIYQELVYNNIEGFISNGFPVLRSLYEDTAWHALVQAFIDGHRCHTPYFLEISQEFLRFLTQEYQLGESDPIFIAELAHYEWVELALDVSQKDFANVTELHDPVLEVPFLSPLAWLLSYQFPVHKIGKGFQPSEAAEPTFLVVYRNPEDDVCFMELNTATARLLELVRDNTGATGAALLAQLSEELGIPNETVAGFGGELLTQLRTQSIICAA
jgi:hypothetical protein